MATLRDWITASRPKTLGAAIAPVAVGSVLGWKLSGQFSATLLACTLGSTICLQIATNFFNDALDFINGADTNQRIGPRRITAAGAASSRSTLTAATLTLVAATLLAIPLIHARGWPIILIGLPSLYFCYGYTGGPHPLAYRGLGELFVILFFGFVAVIGSAFVQTGQWYWDALVAGLQIGCLSTILIAINNLRDVHEDRSTGKKTLAVRFGITFARCEILTLVLTTHLTGLHWWIQGDYNAFIYPLALLPVGLWIAIGSFSNEPGPVYNRYLTVSGLHLILFSALLCLGLASQPIPPDPPLAPVATTNPFPHPGGSR
jgi:1,4-dihydroxy-2-naphthoate octaprenyltransferase